MKELVQVLKKAANDDNTVIMTQINNGFAAPGSLLDLFLESFHAGEDIEHLLNNLVIISVDQNAYDRWIACSPFVSFSVFFTLFYLQQSTTIRSIIIVIVFGSLLSFRHWSHLMSINELGSVANLLKEWFGNRCKSLHPHCYLLRTEGTDYSKAQPFMSKDYLDMMWLRHKFQLSILELGFNFLFTVINVHNHFCKN